MNQPTLPPSPSNSSSRKRNSEAERRPIPRSRLRKRNDKSDVLVSAVISPYLLTHLHHVLQRAEYGAIKEGRDAQAINFAQLRKVLCMDARSMKDASALGEKDYDSKKSQKTIIETKVA
tara:strand:- start:4761 stop:5117 length:357 start_codon:yes stop_codon:yes gene_type:complete